MMDWIVELMKTYHLMEGGIYDLSQYPNRNLAIVPSQRSGSLMMKVKTILGYLKEFFKLTTDKNCP